MVVTTKYAEIAVDNFPLRMFLAAAWVIAVEPDEAREPVRAVDPDYYINARGHVRRLGPKVGAAGNLTQTKRNPDRDIIIARHAPFSLPPVG